MLLVLLLVSIRELLLAPEVCRKVVNLCCHKETGENCKHGGESKEWS